MTKDFSYVSGGIPCKYYLFKYNTVFQSQYMRTGLRRGTDRNVAPIPDEIEVAKSKDFTRVRRSIRRGLYDLFSCFPSQDEFTKEDLAEMKEWRACYAKESQRLWKQDKMQIHHKNPRKNYKDQSIANRIANLFIMSPKYHRDWNYVDDEAHYAKYHWKNMDKQRKKNPLAIFKLGL